MRDGEGPVRIPSVARISPYLVWLAWILWLPFLAVDAVNVAASATGATRIATLSFVTLFALGYAVATLRNVLDLFFMPSSELRLKPLRNWPVAAALSGLGIVLAILGQAGGHAIISGFIFTSAYVGGAFPWRPAAVINVALLGLCALLYSVFAVGSPFMTVFLIPVVSFMVVLVRWSLTTGKDLRAAQEEISRLAVSAERLRIARDLHDLLGHTLSLITLKSELARRLISVSPERADKEMGDVEAAARSTLQEVRDALAQYRRPGVAVELHAARDILDAAGLAFSTEVDEDALRGLDPRREEVLAWTLREGVTNLVRHADARSCALRLQRDGKGVAVELANDGRAEGERAAADGPLTRAPSLGAGLAGLQERAESLGGTLEACFLDGGGFRLRVYLPLASAELGNQ